MSKIKFLVSQDLKSAPLPDEIAKELDVLSGFSNVASTNVVDENPLLQIPISAARKNQNEGRSESRISTLKYICKFYYTSYQKQPERYAYSKEYGYLQIGLKKSDEKKTVLWETPMRHL